MFLLSARHCHNVDWCDAKSANNVTKCTSIWSIYANINNDCRLIFFFGRRELSFYSTMVAHNQTIQRISFPLNLCLCLVFLFLIVSCCAYLLSIIYSGFIDRCTRYWSIFFTLVHPSFSFESWIKKNQISTSVGNDVHRWCVLLLGLIFSLRSFFFVKQSFMAVACSHSFISSIFCSSFSWFAFWFIHFFLYRFHFSLNLLSKIFVFFYYREYMIFILRLFFHILPLH